MIGKLLTGTLLVLTVPALATVTALSVGASTQRCIATTGTAAQPQPAFTAEALVPDSGPIPASAAPGGGCLPDLGTATAAAIPAGTPVDVATAVRTGLAYVGVTSGWYQRCDQLACRAYGYANSGYGSAHTHWLAMLATGHAHPNDPCPPLGSFVFFNTGRPDGHVSLVVQADPTGCDPNVMEVTANETYDHATGNHGGIYQLSLARLEGMYLGGHGYLGWSDPVCAGALLSPGARPVTAAN